MEELLSKDAGEVASEVRALQKEFQKLWTSEFEKAKLEFTESGGQVKEFVYHKGPEDIQFEFLMERYNKLKKKTKLK